MAATQTPPRNPKIWRDDAALGEKLLNRDVLGALEHGQAGKKCPGAVLSGAANGADTLFGQAAAKAGHKVYHLMADDNEPGEFAEKHPDLMVGVGERNFQDQRVQTAFMECGRTRLPDKEFKENKWQEFWGTSMRNYFQVCAAEAVYAVAYRMPTNAANPNPAMDLGGGTGWACQWYIDRFGDEPGKENPADCKLYFYDDGSKGWPGCSIHDETHHKWSKWDMKTGRWEPLVGKPPRPAGLYAGVGGTFLSEGGQKAIADLYDQPSA